MCGIIACCAHQPAKVKKQVKLIYEAQKQRGTQGYGLAIRKPDGSLLRTRSTKEDIFQHDLWKSIEQGDLMLFHHRQPTSSPNIIKCNHPIANENGDMMMVHNGVIAAPVIIEGHSYETTVVKRVYIDDELISEDIKFTDSEEALHWFEDKCAELQDSKQALSSFHVKYHNTYLFLAKEIPAILFSARTNPLYKFVIGNNTYLASSQTAVVNNEWESKSEKEDFEPSYGLLFTDGKIDRVKTQRNYQYNQNFNNETYQHTPYQSHRTVNRHSGVGADDPLYRAWARFHGKGLTTLTYPQWIASTAKPLVDDEESIKIPKGHSVLQHFSDFPECNGQCAVCSYIDCDNYPIGGMDYDGAFHCY